VKVGPFVCLLHCRRGVFWSDSKRTIGWWFSSMNLEWKSLVHFGCMSEYLVLNSGVVLSNQLFLKRIG